MKYRLPMLTGLTLTVLLSGALVADPAPQPQVSFTAGSSGTWNADWSGVTGRTYFAQGSIDLVNWDYLPVIEFGSGLKGAGISTSGASKYFFRLVYVDDAGVTTEQQARDADFDGDGLSNEDEVVSETTDPFNWDSDGDLVPDGLEVHLGGSPVLSNAADDDDSDGMNNAEEYLADRDPTTADPVSDTSSRSLDVFNLTSF